VSYNDDSGWVVFVYIVAIAALIFGGWQCRVSECRQVCSANHDSAVQTFTNECFCRDNDGRLYNPRDSR
jgi:hypothetical protein